MKTPVLVAACFMMALTSIAEAPARSLLAEPGLSGWRVIEFGGEGPVRKLPEGVLEIAAGAQLSGLVYTGQIQRMDYEITLEARRVEGSDFFCGLTFPVGSNCSTLVLGGWGGWVTGISSVNDLDASENETSTSYEYAMNQWYRIRLRVTPQRVQVWRDDESIIDLDTVDKRMGMRWGDIAECMPLGLATWKTRGQIRNLTMRPL